MPDLQECGSDINVSGDEYGGPLGNPRFGVESHSWRGSRGPSTVFGGRVFSRRSGAGFAHGWCCLRGPRCGELKRSEVSVDVQPVRCIGLIAGVLNERAQDLHRCRPGREGMTSVRERRHPWTRALAALPNCRRSCAPGPPAHRWWDRGPHPQSRLRWEPDIISDRAHLSQPLEPAPCSATAP
jgi:hypothetical protein